MYKSCRTGLSVDIWFFVQDEDQPRDQGKPVLQLHVTHPRSTLGETCHCLPITKLHSMMTGRPQTKPEGIPLFEALRSKQVLKFEL